MLELHCAVAIVLLPHIFTLFEKQGISINTSVVFGPFSTLNGKCAVFPVEFSHENPKIWLQLLVIPLWPFILILDDNICWAYNVMNVSVQSMWGGGSVQILTSPQS